MIHIILFSVICIVAVYVYFVREEKYRRATKELQFIHDNFLLEKDKTWNKLKNGGWKDMSKEELQQAIDHCNKLITEFNRRMDKFEEKYL